MSIRHGALFAALLLLSSTQAFAGDPPTITHFVADHTEIVRGQRVELTWLASQATTVKIEPLGIVRQYAYGSYYFWPEETETYRLTATNPYGSSSAELTVTISKQFDVLEFSASDDLIGTQDAVILNWDVFGLGEVTIDGQGPLPMVGTMTDVPHETHTYVLEVRSANEYERREVEVVVTGEWRRSRFLLSYAEESVVVDPDGFLPFTTIPIYVLGESLDGRGLTGVEFGLNLTPDLALFDVDFHSYRAVNVLSSPDFVVGLGSCFSVDPLHLIATLEVMAFNQSAIDDGSLHLRPASIPSVPGTVAYATCDFELEGSEINHPLSSAAIGPILYLSPNSVPVVRMNLRAERDRDLVLLRWDAVDIGGVDRFLLTRSVGSGPSREIFEGDAERLFTELQYVDFAAPYGDLDYALLLYSGEDLVHSEFAKINDATAPSQRSALKRNAPNPFNPSTTLRWSAAVPGNYQMRIVSSSGRLLREFAFSIATPGAQETFWDGRDASGRVAASGVYHVQLIAPDARDQTRVVLLK